MPFSRNVDFVGYDDLEGRAGFKLAMQEVAGRFYLYVAALWEPGTAIVEVTDPQCPRLVRWLDGAPGTMTIQVQVAERKMITSMEAMIPGWGQVEEQAVGGFVIWDLADPEDPQVLGRWAPGIDGVHRSFYNGGRYVHTATKQPGFDGYIYGIVDIDDPADPHLIGKWWWPGQHTAGGETYSREDMHKQTSGRPHVLGGAAAPTHGLHGGPYIVGDRAYAAWMRAGLIVLDVSTIGAPQLVSSLSFYPPLGSSIALHSAVPLPERQLVIVNSEALEERMREPLNFAGVVDVSDETDPILISLFPTPELPAGYPASSFRQKGGRFGPHNQHQPQGQDCLQPIGDYIYLTYFNAGLQVYDISDPYFPRIAGYYIPDDPTERRGLLPTDLVAQYEDVLVDRRGFAYVTEKNSGLTILRFAA